MGTLRAPLRAFGSGSGAGAVRSESGLMTLRLTSGQPSPCGGRSHGGARKVATTSASFVGHARTSLHLRGGAGGTLFLGFGGGGGGRESGIGNRCAGRNGRSGRYFR